MTEGSRRDPLGRSGQGEGDRLRWQLVTTWEYASVITANDAESQRAGVSVKLPNGSLERQQGDTSSVLNRLGGEGWELVSYHSSGAGTWGFEQFWLKRQIS